jgi:hypothetical protein
MPGVPYRVFRDTNERFAAPCGCPVDAATTEARAENRPLPPQRVHSFGRLSNASRLGLPRPPQGRLPAPSFARADWRSRRSPWCCPDVRYCCPTRRWGGRSALPASHKHRPCSRASRAATRHVRRTTGRGRPSRAPADFYLLDVRLPIAPGLLAHRRPWHLRVMTTAAPTPNSRAAGPGPSQNASCCW